jgi:hypothetical protein
MDISERIKTLTPEFLQYFLELRRCERAQKQLDLKEPPNTEDEYWSGARENYIRNNDSLYEWRQLIQTRHLRQVAQKLSISMPDHENKNLYGRVDYDNDEAMPQYLLPEGVRQLRTAIREERKHRREAVGYWFGIAVGLIGALTGLVSAFKD